MTLVRFAPSPTGYLHPGNARVAMYNFLFAHKHKGSFLLRIDDTDKERSEQRFIDGIHEDFAWLGIRPDKVIHQSHRQHLYNKARDLLIAKNRLYPCYETPEELDEERTWQRKIGKPPVYSRASLKLTPQDRQEKEAAGIKPYWRFLLPDTMITWDDMCKNTRSVHLAHMSDPVLIRTNGSLTFLLASVVDDIEEGVTHVIRGDDHISNTAVHIALEYALRDTSTSSLSFGHTTLLRTNSGSVLSKSEGSTSLRSLRSEGLLPKTLWAYLLTLGASTPIPAHTLPTQHAATFDLQNYSHASPLFDIEQAWEKNASLLHTTPYDQLPQELKNACSQSLWACIHDNVKNKEDIVFWHQHLTARPTPTLSDTDKDHIQNVLNALQPVPHTHWAEFFTEIKRASSRTSKEFFLPLRRALTGVDFGPKIPACAHFLGHKEVCIRLKGALNAAPQSV